MSEQSPYRDSETQPSTPTGPHSLCSKLWAYLKTRVYVLMACAYLFTLASGVLLSYVYNIFWLGIAVAAASALSFAALADSTESTDLSPVDELDMELTIVLGVFAAVVACVLSALAPALTLP